MRRSERKRNEPDLGILSSRTLFSLQKELFAALAEQGHPRLRPRHGAVLAYLDEEGSRATDLAARSGQHKQVIGTLVDELEELGYVERRPDPADRRAKLIVPTGRGLDQMARSEEILAAIEERHAEAAGAADYATFKRVFRLVAERQSGQAE
ncbi:MULTISPECIES: MarR family winged helix-turn-helix transcriptional regulator [Nonomuraea]|jgi:DNA-binding MarR family transcriptional regulator|uniref:MarR family winged helix-turn-helix transcriptional regulator n=2 Tax=Nonomuraea TaxID=83681 RepID=A0ABW1C4G8_9ACTN|nr:MULTISPECIES: helix-turn-helix domain-containing protein [Nonomuraea]MDA0646317.1 helix-turn-helix domain-containing protein [Nonomuraea ferruginea]